MNYIPRNNCYRLKQLLCSCTPWPISQTLVSFTLPWHLSTMPSLVGINEICTDEWLLLIKTAIVSAINHYTQTLLIFKLSWSFSTMPSVVGLDEICTDYWLFLQTLYLDYLEHISCRYVKIVRKKFRCKLLRGKCHLPNTVIYFIFLPVGWNISGFHFNHFIKNRRIHFVHRVHTILQ